MILEYAKDQNNQEILQDETGRHQVMMEWEKPYMVECINKLDPRGDVLEIGFGMGYSATAILSHSAITSYTVIECSPPVWDKVDEFRAKHPHVPINLVKGRWEDVLLTLGKYDSIFFDDYVSQKRTRFHDFLKLVLKDHSNIGTRISLYSTRKITSGMNCMKDENYEYEITIPSHCNYANGNKMYIPVLTKISEPLASDLNPSIPVILPKTDKNIIIIDNFLSNPDSVRDFILKEDFSNDISVETYSNDALKKGIEAHLPSPITKWDNCHNGRYELTTCKNTRIVKYHDDTVWSGVLFLTPNADTETGLGFHWCRGKIIKNYNDIKTHKHEEYYSVHKRDMSKWIQTDSIGNIYNRLVLFKSNKFVSDLQHFGICQNTGRLIQVFYFS
jgi:hypothetical protein